MGWRSLPVRLAALLVAAAVVFAGLLLVLERSQNRQVRLLFDDRVAETARVLERIVDLRASGAAVHANDYSRWDEFVQFVRTRDPEWARINLVEAVATFDLDAAWVLGPDFQLVYTANPEGDPGLAALPAPQPRLARHLRENPVRHFYAHTVSGLVEVWSYSIQPSDDYARANPASGYYVIARRWTPERLAGLAQVTSGRVALEPHAAAGAADASSARSGRILIRRPLAGLDGRPVADLIFETHYPVVTRVRHAFDVAFTLLFAGCFGSLLLAGLALNRWVRGPLAAIASALRENDPARLAGASRRRDELGVLARLVEDFFAQQRALAEARETAERAVEAKSMFLANISHELRTPMHGILSYSRFGVRDARTAERQDLEENFRSIEECGGSLLALLNDLLDLAKFEAGRMTMMPGELALGDVVQDAADEFASLYDEHGVSLALDVQEPLPVLLADRTRLVQVLRNLLSNAVKFSPRGGQVGLRAEQAGALARVSVCDSGPGVPAGELESIFDKFVQASGTHPRTGGTGLGLAICREIVDAHGGRIWAENPPQGGARFVFELPFAGPATEGGSAPSRGSAATRTGEQRFSAERKAA